MTRLLVSVRNAAEAEIAARSGVDLIDVKEPARGSLGAADAATIEQVAHVISGRRPLSVALGELHQGLQLPDRLSGRVQFAKFGLAGCGADPNWLIRWNEAVLQLPAGVSAVGVAYADWQAAAAPDPWQVVDAAQQLDCAAILLDTWDKSHGPLTELWSWSEVDRFVQAAAKRRLISVVAGSLGSAEIATLLELAPDYVAVRGAVCAGDRTTAIEETRVRRLVAQLHAQARRTVQRA